MPEDTKLGLGDDTLPGPRDLGTSDTVYTNPEQHALPREPTAEDHEPVRGDSIGRFVVLDVLGSGGMGVVYSGYDPHLDRKVAIKLLRATVRLDAEDARTRLLREAQAMAKINHPNVIKVHEVGTFRDQVYLAMEFADAGTLRTWLAAPRSRREILEAFGQAGRGLAAAHAAGLVHRDFKPDNVLMGNDGSVRVTDFGLVSTQAHPDAAPVAARPPDALEISQSGTTPLSQSLTRTGAIMGTPTYMASEQFNGIVASPRTDQFAFCVALYEALYGGRPFPGTTYTELATQVLLGEVAPAPKTARVPGWLRRVLLRGLATDQGKRFGSMPELLAALSRETVRRRRMIVAGGVAALGTAALVLALRTGGAETCGGGDARFATAWNPERSMAMKAAFDASGRPHAPATYAKVTAQLDEWGRTWGIGYVEACKDTRVRGAQSENLLDLRMECLGQRLDETRATVDLLVAGGADAVDHALDAVIGLPPVTPCADAKSLLAVVPPPETPMATAKVAAVRARLDEARGLRRLARYAKANALATTALAWARSIGYLPATAEALYVVGVLQHNLGDRASAATIDEAMNVATEAGESEIAIRAAAVLITTLAIELGQFDRAKEVATLAEASARRTHPPAEVAVLLEYSIGLLLEAEGKPAEARTRLERARALAEDKLGPDAPLTSGVIGDLGNLAKTQGHFAEARKLLEIDLATTQRVYGADHPAMSATLHNLGLIDIAEGKLDAAKVRYERALAIRIAAYGPDHPEVAESLNSLGTLYARQGDNATAARYYERALAGWEKVNGPDSIEAANALSNIGGALVDRGENAEARVRLERAISIMSRVYGPDNVKLTASLQNLSIVAQNEHKLGEAYDLLQRVLKITETVYGPDHPDVADGLINLADVLQRQHKLEESEAIALRSVRVAEKAYGKDHEHTGLALCGLGTSQRLRHEYPAALESFHRGLAVLEATVGKEHVDVSYGLEGIGAVDLELGHANEAVPLLERALAIRVAGQAAPADVAKARFFLAQALAADPRTRARARGEATAALTEYQHAKDDDEVAEIRAWLDKHR